MVLGLLLSLVLGLHDAGQTRPTSEEAASIITPALDADEDTALYKDVYKDIDMKEWNNRIRREKFDTVLPVVMRKHKIDMWIHVMSGTRLDSFGAEELGSASGVFVFTDRGAGRIERAVLGHRWGVNHREDYLVPSRLVEESGVYDIICDPVRIQEPVGGPMTEYDYRFKGLREFVVERDPQRIAVNFLQDLGPSVTEAETEDGISHTDYLLLVRELGPEYARRIVSSEYLLMDFITRTVPSEIQLLKKMREDETRRVREAFSKVVPGVTKARAVGLNVFRRRGTGISQRGRTKGYEDPLIQSGDILAAPSQGMYAYVLRKGETEPPPEIQKLWAEYLKIDKILTSTIKAGMTPREIIREYTKKFEAAGIILRDNQLHMVLPKNNYPVYSAGFDPTKTELSVDCHAMRKGARATKEENYFGPRIGSIGPDWMKVIPLPPNHHFVLEYFFYLPAPSKQYEDQYLFWWDHEQAIATENGVEYLSPSPKELHLIR
jgi:hypothetical protein